VVATAKVKVAKKETIKISESTLQVKASISSET
jgi:hypothetical protein